MNVLQKLTTVTLTPTAPTPRVRSTARVTRDTLEMESRVWVCTKRMEICLEKNELKMN